MKVGFGFDDKANKTANQMIEDIYPDISNGVRVRKASPAASSIAYIDSNGKGKVIGWEHSMRAQGNDKRYFYSVAYDFDENIFFYQVAGSEYIKKG